MCDCRDCQERVAREALESLAEYRADRHWRSLGYAPCPDCGGAWVREDSPCEYCGRSARELAPTVALVYLMTGLTK